MSAAVEAAALAVSGRVDLAAIALENAMAHQRDTEAAVSAAMRSRDTGKLAEATARLQAAQEGVRAAWLAGTEILKHAAAARECAVQVRRELVNYELSAPGEARSDAATAVARLAADTDSRLRTVEALTLDLKKRWLLPLPSTGEGGSGGRAGTMP